MASEKDRKITGPDKNLIQRGAEFNTLTRISTLISRSESLEKGLEGSIDHLLQFTGSDFGTVHVLDPVKGDLRLITSRGVSEKFTCREGNIPLGDCLCGQAASCDQVLQSGDLLRDHRLTRSACQKDDFRSVMSIPLRSNDRVLGIFTVYSKDTHFYSQSDQELLILLGYQIGAAIDNAKLYADAWEKAVSQERGLISQEIHDSIAQSLAYLNLQAKQLESLLRSDSEKKPLSELQHLQTVIKDTYEDARQLMVDFRTGFDQDEGLINAIRRLMRDFSQRTGVRTEFNNTPSASFPPRVQVQLFRIIQEALSNVRKHASAGEVVLDLSATSSWISVRIWDNGVGFDPQGAYNKNGFHFGLEIMKERAASIGGSLDLKSRPRGGTTLTVKIPVPQEGTKRNVLN